MERETYDYISRHEGEHWWFRGRRAVLDRVIRRVVRPPANAAILDMGCGSGGNVEMLSAFGTVTGVEHDDDMRAIAEARGTATILPGWLPDGIDHVEGPFDLVALLDVLEHIEDDIATLMTLGQKLSDGGRILLSVPALPWLWSDHDLKHHHFRRYTRKTLRKTVGDAGLSVVALGAFNSLLFPAAVAQRLILRGTGHGGSASEMPPRWLNAALAGVFSLERHMIGRVTAPAGLSLWAVLER